MKKVFLTLVIALFAMLIVACGGAVEDAADAVGDVAGDVVDTAGDVVDTAGDVVDTAGDVAGDVAGDAVDAAGDAVDAAGDAVDAVADTAGDAVDAVGDAASDAVDAAGDAAGDAVDAAGDAAGDAADAAGDAVDAVGDAAGDAADAAGDMAGDAVDAAGDAAGEVADTAGDAAGAVAGAVSGDATTYAINAAESTLGWKGAKAAGATHLGGVTISEGSLVVQEGALVEGSFVIDMASITNDDLEGNNAMQTKLLDHLNSDDFFDTANFPTAELAITSAEPTGNESEYAVVGDLTIKGTTAPIEFTAIAAEGIYGSLTATADIVFDRTVYDVNFGSGILGTAADQLINDEVEITISLVASDS